MGRGARGGIWRRVLELFDKSFKFLNASEITLDIHFRLGQPQLRSQSHAFTCSAHRQCFLGLNQTSLRLHSLHFTKILLSALAVPAGESTFSRILCAMDISDFPHTMIYEVLESAPG